MIDGSDTLSVADRKSARMLGKDGDGLMAPNAARSTICGGRKVEHSDTILV
jgi:hypothetical protein